METRLLRTFRPTDTPRTSSLLLLPNKARLARRGFFFFQAEDGIRDLTVTGVQTCALPISRAAGDRMSLLSVGPCGVVQRVDRQQAHPITRCARPSAGHRARASNRRPAC